VWVDRCELVGYCVWGDMCGDLGYCVREGGVEL